jgi:hypothetical protein
MPRPPSSKTKWISDDNQPLTQISDLKLALNGGVQSILAVLESRQQQQQLGPNCFLRGSRVPRNVLWKP